MNFKKIYENTQNTISEICRQHNIIPIYSEFNNAPELILEAHKGIKSHPIERLFIHKGSPQLEWCDLTSDRKISMRRIMTDAAEAAYFIGIPLPALEKIITEFNK